MVAKNRLCLRVKRNRSDSLPTKPVAAQATTAHQIGVSDTLMVAANTSGGVTGKMISPQSIAVACAATGLVGKESDLFRFTLKHSLFFATIVGLITLAQAYWFTGMLVH